MARKPLLLILAMAAAPLLISCEKLEGPAPGAATIDFREIADGVPADYGRFVTATTNNRFAATLWFEQADKTIVGVRVDTARGTVSKSVIRIPRD